MGRAEHERAVRFRTARRDPELTVVEGFHALKHALRFGAELVEAVAVEPEALEGMARDLAPDLAGQIADRLEVVDKETLADLVPLVPHTGVAAIARRPRVDLATALADPAPAPAILLEQPRNMGNIGACIRVSAGGGAAAVITTGENDPWHPDAVRGAAGERPAALGDRPGGGGAGAGPGAAARDPRLRHRAPRPQQRGLRAGRGAGRDPDAGGRLQPQPRDLGGDRPLLHEVDYGCRGQGRGLVSRSSHPTVTPQSPIERSAMPLADISFGEILLVALEIFFFVVWI